MMALDLKIGYKNDGLQVFVYVPSLFFCTIIFLG